MRIGLAGTGRIGAFHAATILSLPDAPELVLTDAVPEAATRVASQLGVDHVASLDELFATGLDGFAVGFARRAKRLRRPPSAATCALQ